MKKLFYLSMLLFTMSCVGVNSDVVEMVGVYEANVIGVDGPFSISISIDYDDNILIDAPFDGIHWEVIEADVDDEDESIKDINIFTTELEPHVWISGEGFYSNGSLQLEYEIDDYGHEYDYTLIATKVH